MINRQQRDDDNYNYNDVDDLLDKGEKNSKQKFIPNRKSSERFLASVTESVDFKISNGFFLKFPFPGSPGILGEFSIPILSDL